MGYNNKIRVMLMVVYVTKKALFTLLTQAVEVFMQEAYGCLLISHIGKNQVVDGVISYATAKRRGYGGVNHSSRSDRALRWISRTTDVVDGWHSHTFLKKQRLCAEPSQEDIDEISIGHFDMIVAVKRNRTRLTTAWRESDLGLRASINGYRFLIRCWKKVDIDEVKELKIKMDYDF